MPANEWTIGATVSVGFVHGLRVTDRISGGRWLLENPRTGALYMFAAHRGLSRF